MEPPASAALVAGTSARTVALSVPLRAELRAAVTAYVAQLRDGGARPGRMLVLVEDTCRDGIATELDGDAGAIAGAIAGRGGRPLERRGVLRSLKGPRRGLASDPPASPGPRSPAVAVPAPQGRG